LPISQEKSLLIAGTLKEPEITQLARNISMQKMPVPMNDFKNKRFLLIKEHFLLPSSC
jgi:hypothetical protein